MSVMPAGASPVTPVPYPMLPVSRVTPFTYRDNMTYLAILQALRAKVDELLDTLNELITHDAAHSAEFVKIREEMRQLSASVDKRLADQDTRVLDVLAKFRQEMLALIGEATGSGTADNPTNGTSHETVSKVIADVYDNLRVHAFFAVQYDEDGRTAAEWDALGWSARHADISPLADTNDSLD